MKLNEFTHELKMIALSFNRYMSKDEETKKADWSFNEWLDNLTAYLENVYENDEY